MLPLPSVMTFLLDLVRSSTWSSLPLRKGAKTYYIMSASGVSHSESSRETAMQLIDEEIERQLSLTRQWKSDINAESHICQLPTEILCRVFLLIRRAYEFAPSTTPSPHKRLPYQFLWIFVVTHVCRHWRTVALNESALWTLPALFLPNLGKLMLERSRMAGLSIEINHILIEQELMDIVLQHFTHTRKFHVLNGSSRGLTKLFSQLPAAAPMLETLIIIHESSQYHFIREGNARLTVPTSLFREVTSLRKLTLKGLDIQAWNLPHFDGLTSLTLDDIPEDQRPSVAQLKAMLSRMRQLTDLALGDACPSSEGSQDPEQVYLPSLRTLKVGMSASQVRGFYSMVAVPPELEAIKTILLYNPEINFIDMFSIAKRAHLLDAANLDGLCLSISSPQGGVVFDVTLNTDLQDGENDDDDDDDDSAVILIKNGWTHYSPTREATAHRHMFTGIMTSLDWSNLEILTINFNSLTPDILRSSIGFLPRLSVVTLRGKIAIPFIEALHSGWDTDPEMVPASLAFARLRTIMFYQVEFSIGEEDADDDSLPLDLLQECLMGRCERGAAIELLMIELCEGICEASIDDLWDLVPDISWDGEEIGFDTDDESSE